MLTGALDEGDGIPSENDEMIEFSEFDLSAVREDLYEAPPRKKTVESERDELLEELALSKAKQQEYMATIMHDKERAIAELEAAKALFNQNLQESIEEKFNLETKLVLAKQDAVELAVQVERLAEISFQQATAHILEDAQLRVSAAETSAAEAAYQIEERVRNSIEGTIMSIVEKSKKAIEKALGLAETASEHTTKAMSMFTDSVTPVGEISLIQTQNIKLQTTIDDLNSKLLLSRSEIDLLKLELEQAQERVNAIELRASDTVKALAEYQESSRVKSLQQEEDIKVSMEKMKKDAGDRKKAVSKVIKVELEAMRAAVDSAKEAAQCKEEAYLRRCEALQRSLKASEVASKMWRQRAELGESLLLRERPLGEREEDEIYVVNGGRVDLLMEDDSQKWKLLSDGPRREIPDWMARRIRSIFPKFPPRKKDVSEALTSKFKSLTLPHPDEVWSIAHEKPKEGDTFIEHVVEKEIIEKKRKALERALQRKTIQWQRTPEQIKLGEYLHLQQFI